MCVTSAVSGGQGGADERRNPASPVALAREGVLSSQTSACLHSCICHDRRFGGLTGVRKIAAHRCRQVLLISLPLLALSLQRCARELLSQNAEAVPQSESYSLTFDVCTHKHACCTEKLTRIWRTAFLLPPSVPATVPLCPGPRPQRIEAASSEGHTSRVTRVAHTNATLVEGHTS